MLIQECYNRFLKVANNEDRTPPNSRYACPFFKFFFLCIDIHLFHHDYVIFRREFVDRHILADFFSGDDLFIQHGRRAALELVAALFLFPLVGRDVVPHEGGLLRRDDADVHVRSRS